MQVEHEEAINAALQNQGVVANEPPTRPAVKLPEFIEVYGEANRINGSHIENGVYAIVKGCYDFIVRQLQA